MFGLNETEVQNGYENAMQNPFDPARDLSPGFFEGAGPAVISGFEDASGKILSRLASKPEDISKDMGFLPTMPRAILGMMFKPEDFTKVIKDNRPNPATTGWLGQQAFALTSMLSRAVAGGGPIGGAALVGETERHATTEEMVAAGVDKATAEKVGNIAGITSGGGVLLPAAIPGKLLTRLGSGAAINVLAGGTYRGSTSKALKDGGYNEMAEQYKILDAAAITTDAILGAGFGAISHGVRPSDRDAALAANNWHQREVESAPGLPVNGYSRTAHIDAMDEAAAQLAIGDQLSVDLKDAEFLPKQVNSKDLEASLAAVRAHSLAAESSLGDSLTPSDITSLSKDARTQDLPFQTSEKTLPLSPFDKRAISPSGNFTGDLSNLDMGTSPTKYYHATRDLQEIRQVASELVKPLEDNLKQIADGVKGAKYFGVRLKEEKSLTDKIARKSDPRSISDFVGGRLVADNPKAVEAMLSRLRERNQVMSVDNFLDGQRAGGYRAVHVQVMSDKGVSVEVQIQPKEIRDVQDKVHGIYKKWQGKDELTPEEFKARMADEAEAKAMFDKAWAKWEERNGDTSAEAEAVKRNPDMMVMDDDGNMVSAKEALDRAKAEEAQTKQEASVFEAAVQCFLRFGDA